MSNIIAIIEDWLQITDKSDVSLQKRKPLFGAFLCLVDVYKSLCIRLAEDVGKCTIQKEETAAEELSANK